MAVDRLQDHVNQLKADSNYWFSQEYAMISRDLDQPFDVARRVENNVKNRYHNVPAYDETRVKLAEIDMDVENASDYINANYVAG